MSANSVDTNRWEDGGSVSECSFGDRRSVIEEILTGVIHRHRRTLTSAQERIGPTGCPETSVRNYPHALRNNPEERSSHLLRGGRPKSRILRILTSASNECQKQSVVMDLFKCVYHFSQYCSLELRQTFFSRP